MNQGDISGDQKRPYVNYRLRVASKSHDKRKAVGTTIYIVTIYNVAKNAFLAFQGEIINAVDEEHIKNLNYLLGQK
jgi:hypothetical protein